MDQYSDVNKSAFLGVTGAFFSLAIISTIARFWIRIATRRPLYWDDLALGIATACLIAATVLSLNNVEGWYLANQLQKDPFSALGIPIETLIDLIKTSQAYTFSIVALTWTTIFAVKVSFLIFFKQLTQRLGKINVYFWIVTCMVVLCWMFSVYQPFIACPYTGAQAVQCAGSSRDEIYVSLNVLNTVLDIVTDMMIVSIPILVLKQSQIPKKQKIILACFFGLSLVMSTLAVIRISKIRSSNIDIVWEVFWQWMEASIAVIMASVMVFRTLVHSGGSSQQKKWQPSATWIQRIKLRRSSEKDVDTDSGLPSIPQGTLSGLRTFIRGNNRSVGAATVLRTDVSLSNMDDTRVGTINEEQDCHEMGESITVTKDITVSSTTV